MVDNGRAWYIARLSCTRMHSERNGDAIDGLYQGYSQEIHKRLTEGLVPRINQPRDDELVGLPSCKVFAQYKIHEFERDVCRSSALGGSSVHRLGREVPQHVGSATNSWRVRAILLGMMMSVIAI
jgi:hypothetical protein